MNYQITFSSTADKASRYEELIPQITSVIGEESDWLAVWSNTIAMLHEAFGFFWVGFYRVLDTQLVAGPFQGPVCCMRIGYGKGVCGTAWKEQRTIIVPDVEQFPGHIACSSLSRSEIVVPLFHEGKVVAVLDIDSKEINTFDSVDAYYLELLMKLLSEKYLL